MRQRYLFNLGYVLVFSIVFGLVAMGCKKLPVTPNAISATDGEYEDKIVVTWDVTEDGKDVSSANESYLVYRSESINTGYLIVGENVGGNSFEDNAVESGKYYYYRVRGVSKSDKESDQSGFDQGYAGDAPYNWMSRAEVDTKYGSLKGISVKEDTCWSWRGIPYAKPPVGDLRWKAPRDPEPWGERDATAFCDYCAQYGNVLSETGRETYHGKVVGKEDCLYLNIWRPQSDEVLPVYVFIHGGANFLGRSDLSIYDGANFATGSDMIFVSINYRLSHLGWFRHPALKTGDPLDDSGNYGTLDILKALEWIRGNIAAFGGDPDNVTLSGQSAGGINTYSMIASPLAKNLFHKAIPISGFPLSMPKQIADNRGEMIISRLLVQDGYAKNMVVAGKVIREKGDEWISEYLRSKSLVELMPPYLAGPSALPIDGGLGIIASMGVYEDGYVIPKNLLQCLQSGDYNQVPMLLGNTIDEMKLFLPLILADPVDLWDLTQEVDPNNVEFNVEDLIFPLFMPFMSIYEPANYLGKMMFQGFGVDTSARAFAKHQQDIYVYKFAWDEEPEPFDLLLGAAHAMDLHFVFNNFISEPGCLTRFAWSDANREGCEELSHTMMTYYSQFAKTGNPNSGDNDLFYWSPWNPEKGADKRIVFDTGELYMSPDVMEEQEIMTFDEMMDELKIILDF
ncbi:MAG: carboxylesterase family protein [Proteobacteria bacterium]|nr:carboxylesterase family protein [Pseudomonadota bacterium]